MQVASRPLEQLIKGSRCVFQALPTHVPVSCCWDPVSNRSKTRFAGFPRKSSESSKSWPVVVLLAVTTIGMRHNHLW